ncbi:MAG: Hydroxypyruvate isomerase [Candidatus Bathyarchaeota archaeon B63]|nr:MAG: Hydroxypyruvate isomerase [Candidatus Bathyarchaeota archaeon B63]
MVRFSVCIEMIFRELPFPERIDAVAEAGYPAFEFWGWRKKNLDEILERKRRNGLDVAIFILEHDGRLVDYSTRNRFMDGLRDSIEAAHKLECPTLLVLVGSEIPDVPRSKQHRSIVNCLREAAGIAEDANVTLAVEPLNILVDHKGYYLYSSREGFEIVREVNSPNVKLLYDIYHQQIMEGNLIDTITKNIDLIAHFHVADVPGRHEPGTGEINYLNVLRSIDEAGYEGYVGLEFRPLTSSEDALRKVMKLYSSSGRPSREA